MIDGRGGWIGSCSWRDKIFIVEYRSDRVPDAICIEPWQHHPLDPTIDLKLDAPSGIELFAAVRHQREPCPGLPEEEQRNWQSTHVVQLRNTSEFDFDDLSLRIETETGNSYMPTANFWDVDPDVEGWRFSVADGTPVRLIVTAPAEPGDS